MKTFLIGLLAIGSLSAFASNKDYNEELKKYVLARLETRIENGSVSPGLIELISKDAQTELKVDSTSLRCLGYQSPMANGKAVGTCLVKAFDKASGGDHLEVMYAVIISEDIEHADVSRNWAVALQQYLYF